MFHVALPYFLRESLLIHSVKGDQIVEIINWESDEYEMRPMLGMRHEA